MNTKIESTAGRDLAAVMDLVRSGQASTRGDIIEQLRLRSSTVSDLVGRLVDCDLVRESVPRQRGRGRPTAHLVYNWQRFGAVFIQVASRSILVKTVDMAGRVIAETSAAPPLDTDNDGMARCLIDLTAQALAHFPSGLEVAAVVCSFSGLLDAPRRIWCFTSRWPNIRNLDVGEALASFGHEVVLIRNLDADLAGRIAESEMKGPERSVLLLHWGYGIGASYHTDGAIVNRSHGRFAEIGHWRLGNARGALCTCGNTDCLETVAALWALGSALQAVHPEIPLDEDAFGPLAQRLDLLSIPAMAEAADQVVRLTGNLSRLFFPDRIILTGPFVQNTDIFQLFIRALSEAPVLRTLDRPFVTQAEPSSRYEMSGALDNIFEIAQDRLLTVASAGNFKLTGAV